MLQKTYGIYSDDLQAHQLFIEAGKNHIACWCKNGENRLSAFEFFQCDNYNAGSFEDLLNNTKSSSQLFARDAEKTFFIWNTNEIFCLPSEIEANKSFMKENMDLLYGNAANTKIFSEKDSDYLIVSRLERKIYDAAKHFFPNAEFSNQYSYLFPSLSDSIDQDQNIAHLFFYPYFFTLIVFKESKLQLAQTRFYNTAEDVLYFILNVFNQYQIDKSATVAVAGFIEEKSKLYETLYQYLEGLNFKNPAETLFASNDFKDYSLHYFLPYINYRR